MERNFAKDVLYVGTLGCGKTMSGRILEAKIGVPFVDVRVKTLLTKFYGETTRKLGEVLEAAITPVRYVVLLDDCETFGVLRSGDGNDVHEVT